MLLTPIIRRSIVSMDVADGAQRKAENYTARPSFNRQQIRDA